MITPKTEEEWRAYRGGYADGNSRVHGPPSKTEPWPDEFGYDPNLQKMYEKGWRDAVDD